MSCEHSVVSDDEVGFACGSCGKRVGGMPTDFAFQMPDEIWALSAAERTDRARSYGTDFWVLDQRRFVRCLLAFPIPGDEFRIGIWVEVDDEVAAIVSDAWDDETKYATLRFEGHLANRLVIPGWTGARTMLSFVTRDTKTRPFVSGAKDTGLDALLKIGWSEQQYLEYVQYMLS